MQLLPGTATSLGISLDDRFDPALAVPAAARYLAEEKARFGSDELMLAAYNAGPGNVEAYGGIPPFTETQTYVINVMAKAAPYATTIPTAGGAGSASVGQVLALNGSLSAGARLEIYPRGIPDLPHMDPRVLGLLVAIAQRYGGVYVSSLKTGHSQYINSSCGSPGGVPPVPPLDLPGHGPVEGRRPDRRPRQHHPPRLLDLAQTPHRRPRPTHRLRLTLGS